MAATNQANTIHFSPTPNVSRHHALRGKTDNAWVARLAVDDGWLPASATSSSITTDSSISNTGSWGERSGWRRSRSLSSLLDEMGEILPLVADEGGRGREDARQTTVGFNPIFELPPLQPLLLPQPLSLRKDEGNRARPKLVGTDDVNNKFRLAGHTPQDNLTEKLACLSRPSPAPAATALPGPVNGNGNSNKKIEIRSKPLPSPPSQQLPPSLPPSLPPLDTRNDDPETNQHETRCRHETPQLVRGEHEVARLGAETNGTLAEQRKPDCDVQQQTQQHLQLSAVPPLTPLSATSPMGFSPMLDRLFSSDRRRRKSKTSPTNTPDSTPRSQTTTSPISPSSSLSQWSFFLREKDVSQSAGQSPAQKIMPRHYIKAGGQTNIGARDSVTIVCRNDFVDVAITRETTAHDILVELKSLGQLAELSSGVIVEQYNALYLERPLRRQERLHDVVGSWSPESRNTLALSHDARQRDMKLDLEDAPKTREAPPGFCLQMYHQSSKRKWGKRHITLSENGKMIASKSPNPKHGDKDVVALCHLSDYDMYNPTEATMRRHLKPPKRYCYAMKSQERINTFLNTEKYVQYLCTEDPEIARKFRSHVQAWRNWHLAKSLLKEPENPPQITTVPSEPRRIVKEIGIGNGHKTRISVDESPYAIGAFKPLIDLDRFNKSIDDFGKDWAPADGAEKNDPSSAAAFPENSLLGAAYEERKQQLEYKPAAAAAGGRRTYPPTPATGESGGSGGSFAEHPKPILSTDRRPQSPDSVRSIPRDAVPGTSTGTRGRNEQVGWFASAAEHSRQQRSLIDQQQHPHQQQLYHQQSMPPQSLVQRRPSTSAGSRLMGGLGRSVSQRRPHPNSISGGSGPAPLHQQQQLYQPPNPQLRRPMRQQPQPLIDLSPEFHEAPQWSRENKGRAVKPQDGRPLVDLATGPALVSGAVRVEQPPKALIHRSEQLPTLMQRQQQGMGAMRPGTSSGQQQQPMVGLGRRGTVRSSAGAGGVRPGTSETVRSGGGVYPPAVGGVEFGRQRGMSLVGPGGVGGGGGFENNGLGIRMDSGPAGNGVGGGGGGYGQPQQPDPRVMQYVMQQQQLKEMELQRQQQQGNRMGRLRTTSGGSQPQ
ncbi:hypothetical protein QBC36DRAFT_206105 [Triangularia setosa]|uniref:Ras-associating domain-containing protein n=1 Tax=Triangularia setosa TaxID=2587417 RepID=A0AAN7ABA0_9PEZI|nr:hypothetical protein QBC36DRAFT_206105 [Podospora setosa]